MEAEKERDMVNEANSEKMLLSPSIHFQQKAKYAVTRPSRESFFVCLFVLVGGVRYEVVRVFFSFALFTKITK